MFLPDGAPFFPPLSPPPRARAVARAGRSAPYGYATAEPLLSTPAGVERGAWICLPRAGYATTAREVALRSGSPRPRGDGRSQRLCVGAPRLAAAPASNETDKPHRTTGLAHGRPRSGRRRWHSAAAPFTTTAGMQCRFSNHGGDASFRRSLSRKPEAKSRLPSLPPAGGREGRGGEWGVVQRLAREKTSNIPSRDTREDQ